MNKKQGLSIGIALMLLFMLITVPVIANSYVWKEPLNTTKFGESGIVINVVDGDTFDVKEIGRIRLADVNTPEIDTEEGKEAKEYVKGLCYQKMVYLDIDDLYITGKYGRIVAVVYVPYNETHYVNLNQLLLKESYAEARNYPNEFDLDVWIENPLEYIALTPSPLPTLTPAPTPMPSPSPVYTPLPSPTISPTPTPISGFEPKIGIPSRYRSPGSFTDICSTAP